MIRNVRLHSNSSSWRMSANQYDFDEIGVVLSGEAITTTENGHQIHLKPGTTLLIPSQTIHECVALEAVEFAIITYYSSMLHRYGNYLYRSIYLNEQKKISYTQMDENTLLIFNYHFQALQEEQLMKRKDWEEASRLHMEATLLALSRLFNKSEYSPDLSQQSLWHAAKVIEAQYMEQFKVESLALDYHMSSSSFREKFKIFFGVSPKQYLMNIRLDEAKRYLKETNYPITDISINSGFSSIQQFNMLFKKIEGVSPLDWRKKRKLLERRPS